MSEKTISEQMLYYATNRKGSKDEPSTDGEIKSAGFTGRQKYYGPHRKESVTYGQITAAETGFPSLKCLNSVKDISIESNTDVLIFVHGFNTKFETSMLILQALATAVMNKKESERNITFMMYSWPSMGSPFAYMQDECSVQYSYPYFKQFMDELKAQVSDSSKIHLVAHSLGSQLVYRYLLDHDDKLGTVILSCPDLDYQTVAIDSERQKLSQSLSRGYILVSDIDSPLELSRALHGYTRLGRPALPSAKSLFWGTFRTGSIPNIVSTAAHAPELLARRALRRIQSGFRNPDKVWQEENIDKGIEFAENIKLYDFTMADRKKRAWGHSICIDLVSSLFLTDTPPIEWSEEVIVKIPDEFVECSIFPYARSTPYKSDEQKIFRYSRLKL